MRKDGFDFTPYNLLDNLEKLGRWSSYLLASKALTHYYPEYYDEHGSIDIMDELQLLKKLGCEYWQDAITKYHKEIGYTKECLACKETVNAS